MHARNHQKPQGIRQPALRGDLRDAQRHHEEARHRQKYQLALARRREGDVAGQPGEPIVDPHQRHEHQYGFQVVGGGVGVRDQVGELREREDENQVEEQLDGADPLYLRRSTR